MAHGKVTFHLSQLNLHCGTVVIYTKLKSSTQVCPSIVQDSMFISDSTRCYDSACKSIFQGSLEHSYERRLTLLQRWLLQTILSSGALNTMFSLSWRLRLGCASSWWNFSPKEHFELCFWNHDFGFGPEPESAFKLSDKFKSFVHSSSMLLSSRLWSEMYLKIDNVITDTYSKRTTIDCSACSVLSIKIKSQDKPKLNFQIWRENWSPASRLEVWMLTTPLNPNLHLASCPYLMQVPSLMPDFQIRTQTQIQIRSQNLNLAKIDLYKDIWLMINSQLSKLQVPKCRVQILNDKIMLSYPFWLTAFKRRQGYHAIGSWGICIQSEHNWWDTDQNVAPLAYDLQLKHGQNHI